MKARRISCVVFLFIFALFVRSTYGIEISPKYTQVQAGGSVQFSVKAIFVAPFTHNLPYQVDCYLEINYGDGTGWRTLGLCEGFFCMLTSSHRFLTPGNYTVTVRSSPNRCERRPVSPDPVTARVLVTCPPIVVETPPTLPSGKVGRFYATRIVVSSGAPPYHFAIVEGTLPPGLYLTSSGEIQGVPTRAGFYTFSVKITDSCFLKPRRVIKTFSIEILETCKPMAFSTPETLSTGKVGVPYAERLRVSGGYPPIRFNLLSGILPEGLHMNSSGDISGVPQRSGHYSFVVEARDSCPAGPQKVTGRFVLEIQETCEQLEFTSPSSLRSGVVGSPYTEQILVRGGRPPLSFRIVSGSLPPGLVLNYNGVISGTCQSAGNYSFVVEVSDSCPSGVQRKSKKFVIKVTQKGLSVFVTANPTLIRVPRRSRFTQTINYNFSSMPKASFTMTSTKGMFVSSGTVLGTIYKSLKVNVIGGAGSVGELLAIPPSISMRAEKLGVSKVDYVREFAGEGQRVRAIISIYFTTEAAGEFRIKRIRLFFENNRSEITVNRNAPPPKVFAEIQYTGSGLLRAYWEVDGRILHRVFKHLSYGNSITLETPPVPPIPTFMVGSHVVRFVVLDPRQVFEFPKAVYFVSAEPYVDLRGIELLEPKDGSTVSFENIQFSWRLKKSSASVFAYLVEFFNKPLEKAFFSALVKGESYTVPERLLDKVFSQSGKYVWRVQGLNRSGETIVESGFGTFDLLPRPEYVENQVVVLVPTKELKNVVNLLQRKYRLKLLYSYKLTSLGSTVAVFYTDGDVISVVKLINSTFKNFVVQPNYIYRSMVNSLENLQVEYRLLNLASIHRRWMGRGVVVSVVDTGVDIDHNDIRPHVKKAENFIRNEKYKAEIHGTAVAGLICASEDGVGTTGIAPGVELLAMRACRQIVPDKPEAECYSTSIVEAVDRSVSYGANIVNMSFGSPADDPILRKLIEKAVEVNSVIFVAPVGNDPDLRHVNFPASHPKVLAVAGFDQKGKVYPNERIIDKVDIIAPCRNIMTTFPRGSYNFISGTSMSSAVVSALVALSIEKDRDLDVWNIVKKVEKPLDVITFEKFVFGDLKASGTSLQSRRDF